MKKAYQSDKRRCQKIHRFRRRMNAKNGRRVLANRRRKGKRVILV